jgi:hypothetical protein
LEFSRFLDFIEVEVKPQNAINADPNEVITDSAGTIASWMAFGWDVDGCIVEFLVLIPRSSCDRTGLLVVQIALVLIPLLAIDLARAKFGPARGDVMGLGLYLLPTDSWCFAW